MKTGKTFSVLKYTLANTSSADHRFFRSPILFTRRPVHAEQIGENYAAIVYGWEANEAASV